MSAKIVDGRIVVATRATPDVLVFLPTLEGRRIWLKGGGLSVEDTPHNRSAVEGKFGPVSAEEEDVKIVGLQKRQMPNFKRKPEPHQIEALQAIGDKDNFALFMEQGTGKTKVGIDWACALFVAGEIDAVLVLSKRGVHRQWIEEEVEKDCSVDWDGAFWDKKAIPDRILKKTDGKLLWFGINWDAIKTAGGFAAAQDFCLSHKNRLLIIGDESQEIKNIKSLRSKAAFKLKRHANRRLITTGTPIAKDLTDEWAQLMWLDESIIGCKYITTFRSKYCIMGGFEGRQIIGHKNMEEFKGKVGPHSFRRTKEQIGILPKRYTEWKFDLTRDQKKMIRSIKDDLLAEISEGVEININTAASAFSKIQQVACGFLIDQANETTHRLMPVDKNPRTIAAMEWLAANEGKAIIWSAFIEDKAILVEAMKAAGISFCEYHGATSEADRKAAKDTFLDPDGAQVLIAGKSASTGLNLQGLCNRALYYSNSFNAIDRWQSEDRIHRIGTVGAVTFTDLIGVGSTDRHIRRNLLQKEGIARMSLGDYINALEDL